MGQHPLLFANDNGGTMGAADKFDNATDKLGGQAKETVGKVTGDKERETEGKVDQGKADAKDFGDKIKDKVEDAKDSVKGAVEGLKGDGKN